VTIREHLTRQKRRCSGATYLAFIVFAAGAIAGAPRQEFVAVGLLGFALAFVSIVYLIMGIRCPRCRERIGQLRAYVGGPFSVPRKLRFCPICGVDLDSPIPNEAA
jgi:hypothetical protein